MNTVRVTATEFQNAVGRYSDEALSEPVTITKQGRDHLVLLPAEEYARLRGKYRTVGLAGDIADDMLAAVLAAKSPEAASAFYHEVK
jgi:prevent-host-death family protein